VLRARWTALWGEQLARWLAGLTLAALFVALPRGGPAGASAGCPPLPAPYDGPIFDASVQAWDSNLQGLIENIAGTGVTRIALFANTRQGGDAAVAAVLAAQREHPDLIVAGTPKIGFILGGDLPAEYVSTTLAGIADRTYRFIGEILYTHGDKPDHPPTRNGEVYVDPLAHGTVHLLDGIKGRHVPLLTHWESWAWDRDWPHFDRLYATWPQQQFVLPSLAYGSPEQADTVLSAHTNVWGIISRLVDGRYQFVDPAKQAKLGPPMSDACGVLRSDWRALLLKHRDHLMYGSDDYATARVGWDVYPGIIQKYRRIAGQLPPDVAREISWDNAAALYGGR